MSGNVKAFLKKGRVKDFLCDAEEKDPHQTLEMVHVPRDIEEDLPDIDLTDSPKIGHRYQLNGRAIEIKAGPLKQVKYFKTDIVYLISDGTFELAIYKRPAIIPEIVLSNEEAAIRREEDKFINARRKDIKQPTADLNTLKDIYKEKTRTTHPDKSDGDKYMHYVTTYYSKLNEIKMRRDRIVQPQPISAKILPWVAIMKIEKDYFDFWDALILAKDTHLDMLDALFRLVKETTLSELLQCALPKNRWYYQGEKREIYNGSTMRKETPRKLKLYEGGYFFKEVLSKLPVKLLDTKKEEPLRSVIYKYIATGMLDELEQLELKASFFEKSNTWFKYICVTDFLELFAVLKFDFPSRYLSLFERAIKGISMDELRKESFIHVYSNMARELYSSTNTSPYDPDDYESRFNGSNCSKVFEIIEKSVDFEYTKTMFNNLMGAHATAPTILKNIKQFNEEVYDKLDLKRYEAVL